MDKNQGKHSIKTKRGKSRLYNLERETGALYHLVSAYLKPFSPFHIQATMMLKMHDSIFQNLVFYFIWRIITP